MPSKQMFATSYERQRVPSYLVGPSMITNMSLYCEDEKEPGNDHDTRLLSYSCDMSLSPNFVPNRVYLAKVYLAKVSSLMAFPMSIVQLVNHTCTVG